MTLKRSREDREVEAISMANCLMILSKLGKSTAGTTASAAPDRVFACKTCNKQFPTFQALGGHRASHKRPKLMAADVQGTHSPAKPKIHECSICGLEFSLGQALGGHMRRHRDRSGPETDHTAASVLKTSNTNRIFGLDLNLTPYENDLKLGRAVALLDCFV